MTLRRCGTVEIRRIRSSQTLRKEIYAKKLDEFFIDLTRCFRKIFACAPWNEYLKCVRVDCSGKLGVDDLTLNQTISESSQLLFDQIEKSDLLWNGNLCCPICGAKLELFYPVGQTQESLKREFLKNITGALIYDSRGILSGFIWGWWTTYDDLWKQKLSTLLVGKFSELEYKRQLSRYSRRLEDPVFYFAEWGLSPHLRGQGPAVILVDELRTGILEGLGEEVNYNDLVSFTSNDSTAYHFVLSFSPTFIFDDGESNICFVSINNVWPILDEAVGKSLKRPSLIPIQCPQQSLSNDPL